MNLILRSDIVSDKIPKERLCLSCDAEVAKMFREIAEDMHITMSALFAVMVLDFKEQPFWRIK